MTGAGGSGRTARLLGPGAAAVVATSALGYVTAVDPNVAGHYPTCPFLSLTGWYCPGCGSLRALHALTHGNVLLALDRNALLVLVALPVLAVLWAGYATRSWQGAPRRLGPPWPLTALLVLVVGFTVVRNLPFGAVLAP